MRNRTLACLAGTALVALALVPVVSGAATAPANAKLGALFGQNYKINRYVQSNLRWSKDVTLVRSGGTVTISNKSPDEIHTLSVVTRSQLPRTTRQLDSCFPNGICGKFGKAHQFPDGNGPPGKPLVDVGGAGFDRSGDSIVINSKATVKIKIGARKGTTLRFMCAIHPWMQARFDVQ